MKNLDPKIAVPVLLLVIAAGVFFVMRSAGVMESNAGGNTALVESLPPLPTKPPLKN